MVRRYQIRLMRSVNARCVSIGLVLALSNCSESGGEPDAMLDLHHPGTGIDSHHPQFHNSYGNMKFIIIVINPTLTGSRSVFLARDVRDVRALQVLARRRFSLSARVFFRLSSVSPRCLNISSSTTTTTTTTTANKFPSSRTSSTQEMGFTVRGELLFLH